MNSELAIMGVTFATVSAVLAAIGMLVRDLFYTRVEPRRRLELAAEEPQGEFNRAFFHLVEESGTSLSMGTALLIVMGGAIVGGGILLVFTEHLLAAAGGMVLGAALPILVFTIIRWWRVRAMMTVLPQALQAVADCVRSGQTLSETMQLVSKEIKGPLGSEFAYGHSQLELGHSPLSVMNRMVRRVPIAEFRIFATIVLPLARPALATLGIFAFIYHWNEVLWTMTVTRTAPALQTVPVGIYLLRGAFFDERLQSIQQASLAVSVVPVIVLFLMLQRFYVKGLTAGSVKG